MIQKAARQLYSLIFLSHPYVKDVADCYVSEKKDTLNFKRVIGVKSRVTILLVQLICHPHHIQLHCYSCHGLSSSSFTSVYNTPWSPEHAGGATHALVAKRLTLIRQDLTVVAGQNVTWGELLQLDHLYYIHIISLPQAVWHKEQQRVCCPPCKATLFTLMNADEYGANFWNLEVKLSCKGCSSLYVVYNDAEEYKSIQTIGSVCFLVWLWTVCLLCSVGQYDCESNSLAAVDILIWI